MSEEGTPGEVKVDNIEDMAELVSFLKDKKLTVQETKDLLIRYSSSQISVEDKKTLLAFFDEKMRRAGFMKGVYRKILMESIDFLDELPEAAKRWNMNAYINFLKQLKSEGLIKKLGER